MLSYVQRGPSGSNSKPLQEEASKRASKTLPLRCTTSSIGKPAAAATTARFVVRAWHSDSTSLFPRFSASPPLYTYDRNSSDLRHSGRALCQKSAARSQLRFA